MNVMFPWQLIHLGQMMCVYIYLFGNTQTKEIFNIYHKVSCKSNYVIFLLECLLCKIKYVRKSKTPFHTRLNNHRKDIKNPNAIEACQHFNKLEPRFP